MKEIWKTVSFLPEYEASSLGRVRRVPFVGVMPHGGLRSYGGEETFGTWRPDNRRYAILFRGKNYKVARMVCDAFHGPPPDPEAVCMHIDEDSKNNKPENLAWGTQRENLNAPGFVQHCRESRLRAWNGNVLTDEQIREIRSRKSEVKAQLAREFGVSACHISNVIAGRCRIRAGGL